MNYIQWIKRHYFERWIATLYIKQWITRLRRKQLLDDKQRNKNQRFAWYINIIQLYKETYSIIFIKLFLQHVLFESFISSSIFALIDELFFVTFVIVTFHFHTSSYFRIKNKSVDIMQSSLRQIWAWNIFNKYSAFCNLWLKTTKEMLYETSYIKIASNKLNQIINKSIHKRRTNSWTLLMFINHLMNW